MGKKSNRKTAKADVNLSVNLSAAADPGAEPELVPPTNDVVFKYVFGDERNKGVTAKLLSAIMDAEIDEDDISFSDPHLNREFIDDKMGILDMFVRLKNGKKVAVEMLTGNFSNIQKRVEYYISKMTAAQLGDGNEYPKLTPVVFILIATDPVLKNTDKYHSEFAMMEKSEHYVLHELRTLHIIELSKLPPNSHGRLVSWLKFILAKSKEELVSLIKENPELTYACNALVEVNMTAEVRALYEVDLKRRRDAHDMMEYAVNKALEEAAEKAAAEKEAALKNAAEKAEADKETALKKAAKKAAAEKDAALKQTLDLVKQGYSAEQIETLLRKKK